MFQWKISFHLKASKKTQELIFSRKLIRLAYSPLDSTPLVSNSVNIIQSQSRKSFNIIRDSRILELHLK